MLQAGGGQKTPAISLLPAIESASASPEVDPQVVVNELYTKAKAAHAALYLEPRHPALEGTFVELGAALKSYEDKFFNVA